MKNSNVGRFYRQIWFSAVIALAVLVLLANAHILPRLEWMAGDFLQRLAVAWEPNQRDLEFVVLDQRSLDKGATDFKLSWPWPRATYAKAVRFLQRSGARWIFLDSLFSEPSLYGPEDDRVLAEAVSATANVSLPVMTRSNGPAPMAQALSKLKPLIPLEPVLASDAKLPVQKGCGLPIPDLLAGAGSVGDARLTPDADGVIRRIQPVVKIDGLVVPHFGLIPQVKTTTPGWLRLFPDHLELGAKIFPLDSNGRLVLRFPGSWQNYPSTSLIDILTSENALAAGKVPAVDPVHFRGKVVILGATAEDLFEPRKTALEAGTPEFYATAAVWAAAESGKVYQERWKPILSWPLILLLTGLGALLGRQRFGRGLLFSSLTLACFLGLGLWLFFSKMVILELVSPILGFLLAFALSTSLSFRHEQSQKHFMQNVFSQMLSSTVLDDLIKNPHQITDGGELKEVTIYFSDLAGFTHFSERLDPRELVSKLNTHFGEMIETIVEETGGYVDKFIGDAVMAFWGAPVADRDHAFNACRAALRNQEKMQKLRARLGKEFPLGMRIGIHTGPVVVGMMGSPKKLNYTIIGDAVNLASRLEGVNKVFGTEILISESTYRRLQDRIVARELDYLQVKGKSKPTGVYELIGLPKQVSAARMKQIKDFQQGIQLYHARKFQEARLWFRKAADAQPDDQAAVIYLERCQRFIHKPPPPNWDGVTAMKTK